MQPPARRAAEGAKPRALLVQYEDAQNWRAARDRSRKRRLIGEPQVIPQPDKGGTALRIRFHHQNKPPSPHLHLSYGGTLAADHESGEE